MSGEAKHAAVEWSARTELDILEPQDDRMRPLTPAEREWKETIYQRLLKVLDLSLLASVEDKDARRQIREVCESLLARGARTAQRRFAAEDHPPHRR